MADSTFTPKLIEVEPRSEFRNVSLDPTSFSSTITQHGIRLAHHRAFRCPVGLVDLGDNRRPHDDHSGCDNGSHHVRVGELVCRFTGNSEAFRQNDVGYLDGSTVQPCVAVAAIFPPRRGPAPARR